MISAVPGLILLVSVGLGGQRYGNVPEDFPVPRAPHDLAQSPLKTEGLWKLGPDCGANCLYVFLNLSGVSVSFQQIRSEVTTTGRGASLGELKETADRYGVHAQVLRVAPDLLRDLVPPLVALMGDAENGRGHYVVVCGFGQDGVWLVDGTTGESIAIPDGAFNRDFSGYIMKRSDDRSSETPIFRETLIALCTVESVVLMGLLVCRGAWKIRQGRQARK